LCSARPIINYYSWGSIRAWPPSLLLPLLGPTPGVATSLLRGRRGEEGGKLAQAPPAAAMDAETGDTRSPLLPHHLPSQTQVTESPIPSALLLFRVSRSDSSLLQFYCCSASSPEYMCLFTYHGLICSVRNSETMLVWFIGSERKKEKTNTTCCFLSPILCVLCFLVSVPQHGDFFFSLQVSSANQHYNKPFSWKAPAIILGMSHLILTQPYVMH